MDTAFRTERLILRPARPGDLDDLHEIFSDPFAMRYWDHPADTGGAGTRAFLHDFITAPTGGREEYILEREGKCIGKAGLWRRHELGYLLNRAFWGQGLITEACAAILPRAWAKFPETGQILAQCDPRNLGSRRVLEKLGFRLAHIGIRDFLYGGREWCDTARFVLDRPQ